jgi:hypothetical protein
MTLKLPSDMITSSTQSCLEVLLLAHPHNKWMVGSKLGTQGIDNYGVRVIQGIQFSGKIFTNLMLYNHMKLVFLYFIKFIFII